MVANHAPVFVVIERPLGQQVIHTFVVMCQHRLDHVCIAVGLHQVKQRMCGAIGIPQRENSVVGKTFGFVNILIKTTVRTIHILVYIWSEVGMIL